MGVNDRFRRDPTRIGIGPIDPQRLFRFEGGGSPPRGGSPWLRHRLGREGTQRIEPRRSPRGRRRFRRRPAKHAG
ncbi:MAG: hypothetical protein ACK55I_21885, partial [bacterium]